MAKLRRREDSWWDAGRKRAVRLGASPDPATDHERNWADHFLKMLANREFEEAKPGDVWEVRQDPRDGRTQTVRLDPAWTVIGYVLTCPNEQCSEGVHQWTHARDCKAPFENCKNGGPSCWNWEGTIEDGDLTGNPSLWASADLGGCGWHGYLRHGEMQSV